MICNSGKWRKKEVKGLDEADFVSAVILSNFFTHDEYLLVQVHLLFHSSVQRISDGHLDFSPSRAREPGLGS